MTDDHQAPIQPSASTSRAETRSPDEPLARVLLGVIVVFLLLLVLAAATSI